MRIKRVDDYKDFKVSQSHIGSGARQVLPYSHPNSQFHSRTY